MANLIKWQILTEPFMLLVLSLQQGCDDKLATLHVVVNRCD